MPSGNRRPPTAGSAPATGNGTRRWKSRRAEPRALRYPPYPAQFFFAEPEVVADLVQQGGAILTVHIRLRARQQPDKKVLGVL